MIRPSLRVERITYSGRNAYGEPLQGLSTFEMVAPVRLQFDVQHTTVRTDSAASHGHASEETASVILLALPNTKIIPDDVLVVLKNKVKVYRAIKQYTVAGVFDHVELHCTAWK